eukprot:768675-Hanusia_phi.AAC.5
MHNAMIATGGSAPKRGPAVTSNKQPRRPQQTKDLNFEHEVNRLVKVLDNQDKLPAIVFCMSRKVKMCKLMEIEPTTTMAIMTMSVMLRGWEMMPLMSQS